MTVAIPAPHQTKLRDGIVAFIDGDLSDARRLLALDVRNAFPMISLGKNPVLIHRNSSIEVIEKYEHLSIPSDLRLHITSPKDQIMFDVSSIWGMLNFLYYVPVTHFFTHVGLPYSHTKALVKPGKREIWNQAALINPIRDKQFSQFTRFGIEFFLHSSGFNAADVRRMPLTMPNMNMRLASDARDEVFGPFWFGAIQRRNLPARLDMMFSIRMFFAEPDYKTPSTFTFVPLGEFVRRPR